MFFPESCELAVYKYTNGLLHPSRWSSGLILNRLDKWKDWISFFGRFASIGVVASGGVEGVVAKPIGGGIHDSTSWLEWFYTGILQYANLFGSSNWIGISGGYTKGPVSVGYSAFYYEYTESIPVRKLEEDGCFCTALRFLVETAPGKVKAIFKSLFGN